MSVSPSKIEPLLTSQSEAMRRAMVLFPLPEGPTSAIKLPSGISIEMP